MNNVQKSVQTTNLRLFLVSTVLILFFIVAVKFNIRQASLMLDQQWPEIKTEQWITEPLDIEKTYGKVLLIFFYKEDVEIAEKLLEWSKSFQEKFGRGFLTVALVSEPDDGVATQIKKTRPNFYAAIDNGKKNRKNYRHASFATYYLVDRGSIIRYVGDGEKGKALLEKKLEELLR